MRLRRRRLKRKALGNRLHGEVVELLGKSVPGGIMGGYLEPGFPLYCVNARMLSYLGYESEEAFSKDIQGLVLNCMHPDDRAYTERVVREAFAQNREYEIQYRMRKKDGTYIWVNDVGKRSVEAGGREICLSVVRDISLEIESEGKAMQESAEREKQVRRYDNLFQSVLCGIVQYRLAERLVRFKDANREAIRIFGYTPEAFWAKKEWDLSALVAEEDRARILAEVGALRQAGDKKSYEYRLLQADGKPCWIVGSAEVIRDVDGELIVRSVFLDINASKEAELRNRELSERVEAGDWLFKKALEHTSICEFYYYPAERRLVFPERACAYYHCAPSYEPMPERFVETFAAPLSRTALYEMFERIHRGEKTASAEFCVRDSGAWCRMVMSVISRDAAERPSMVVGVAEDITKEKEMERALEDAHSRDALTKLYSKEAGIALVRALLLERSDGQECVLMLLDMDDFGRVNAEEGSVFADAILQDVADILREETQQGDVLVRLGGDEFMLFLKGRGKAEATVIGPRIAERVRALCAEEERSVSVSVSIGMCATCVADTYDGLYRCAESALLYVKEHARGQAVCYLDTSNEVGIALTQLYENEHPCNAIDNESPRREENLVDFAMELLGKAKKLDDAIFLLLARIGRRHGFDRISILEINPEYLSCRYTYQWSKLKADSQMGRDFYLSKEAYASLPRLYDAEGLCAQRVFPHEGLPSCLHAAIWDQGVYAGALEFESRREAFAWTEEQRRLLVEMTKLIASFIMKARADAVSRAKSDFLSRMSHEIRTPMNAIAGMTTIAKTVAGEREKTLDCLEKIEASSAYLMRLINDILDMSRIESGKMELNCESADLGRQLEKLEQILLPQAQARQILLAFVNRYEGGPLCFDVLRLNQVLINIIGNAIKFTLPQGRVTVSVDPKARSTDGVRLRFSVRDTGIGISAQAQERIFNVFEQGGKETTAEYGGTGLGLSIASRLVQMMGGKLEVSSAVGKGSEFFFTLPLAYGAHCAEQAPPEAEKLPDFSGKRLLLAEDNELNREIAVSILEMQGFSVESAVDGGEAVRLFAEQPAFYYDAVLMDIRMPVLNGLEATKKIRTLGKADSRAIPIIALTANAFDEDTRKSMESGMNGHLAKPIDVPQLMRILQNCLNKS